MRLPAVLGGRADPGPGAARRLGFGRPLEEIFFECCSRRSASEGTENTGVLCPNPPTHAPKVLRVPSRGFFFGLPLVLFILVAVIFANGHPFERHRLAVVGSISLELSGLQLEGKPPRRWAWASCGPIW